MRRILLISLLLAVGCGTRQPIRSTLLIEPAREAREVTITLTTDLDATGIESPSIRARVDAERALILDGRDAWSARFAAVTADRERLVLEKTARVLRRAERSATLEASALQRFFADTGITVHLSRADGWSELAIYPPASARASRQQRERVMGALATWSEDASRYFLASHHLYSYLNAEPQRAEAVFAALLESEEGLSEEETALVMAVSQAMERIVEDMESAQTEAFTIDEDFDLVFNPFPAVVSVRLPAPIEALEGFVKKDERTASIERRGIFDAIMALEGRWISPDPLAIMVRSDRDATAVPPASELAALPRRSSPVVTPAEISREFSRYFAPEATYRVRWRD